VISHDLGPPGLRRGTSDFSKSWWNCPFHADSNPSLTVTPNGEGWICFGCGEKGDAISWIRKRNPQITFSEARRQLKPFFSGNNEMSREPRQSTRPANTAGVSLANFETGPDSKWRASAADVLARLGTIPTNHVAAKYLRKRGLNRENWENASVTYCAQTLEIGELMVPSGIIIPWFDNDGIVALQIRKLNGSKRYQMVSGSHRKSFWPCKKSCVS
jgi:hypothetical protein